VVAGMGRICCWKMAVLLSVGVFCPLHAQNAPRTTIQSKNSTDSKAKPKARKVWTNDNITSLRTPADEYQEWADEKNTGASASAEPQKSSPASGAPGRQNAATNEVSLPDNVEAVEQQIQKTEQEIRRKQSVLDEASAAVASAGSDLERSELQSNVEGAKLDLDTSNDELKQLQARLAQLKSNRPPDSEPAKTSN
jgi:chromosome segregation ATPase